MLEMQADAVLLLVILQGLVQEGQWSLGIKLCYVFERDRSRKLVDEALLLMLVSHNQQFTKMIHDNKLLTSKDAWIYLVLLETKLLKLTGQGLLPKLEVWLDSIQSSGGSCTSTSSSLVLVLVAKLSLCLL